MTNIRPIDLVLSKLPDAKPDGDGWRARCPAHDGKSDDSLSIKNSNGTVLLKCHSGCEFIDVVEAMGLQPSDLFSNNGKDGSGRLGAIEKTYDYIDAGGNLVYQAVRFYPKAFRPRRPDGNGGWEYKLKGTPLVLYRLPELLKSDPSEWVYLVEGEKSADAIAKLGLTVTTTQGGADGWKRGAKEYAQALRRRRVCILPDNDKAGRKYASDAARSLVGVAADVRILALPDLQPGRDPFDWVAGGGDAGELLGLTEAAMLEGIVQADELGPDPDPLPLCPPLPEEARLDPALGAGAGGWLYWYTDHAEAISPMTPTSFHVFAGLWLASVVIARRLVLPMHFANVYPNLFGLWLAPTTLYRKTTALDVARDLARRVIPHLMAAQDTTPEAFLSDLAGREPAHADQMSTNDVAEWTVGRDFAAQRGWVLDEMSGLLAASGRDYNAGLAEALLRFYDCDARYTRSTRGQGMVTVRNSYLAMIGASTPAAMSQHLNSEHLWSMGFWPRFAILTPNGTPEWKRAKEHAEPPELATRLKRLYDALPVSTYPAPVTARTVAFAPGVYDAWERYNKALSYDLLVDGDLDPRLHGTYGRLPVQVLKVAIILAALDWSEPPDGPTTKTPTIELAHLARAMTICEEWRVSAHRALEMAKEGAFDRVRVRILRQIGRYMPNGATLRDLYHDLKKEPLEIESALLDLVKLGEVETVEVKPGKKGGRPTKRYRLV